ncbi:MAG: response regulator, partial [Candidatus Eisenbacteria bacterium]|nr:response regulator [Candidatus Eisenbacteria bacterium]
MDIRTILCVEDQDFDAESLHRNLRRVLTADLAFHHARSLTSAREFLNREDRIEALFVDLEIDGSSGLELVRERRRAGDLRPMIMVTGHGDEAIAAACLKAGADDYLPKSHLGPATIRRALTHAQSERERRTAQEQLRQQKRHLEDLLVLAEQGARAKAAFLANVTHELRTPLTAILGSAESLLEDRLSDAERMTALQAISTGGKHLLSLISDVLDLSKSEAGALEVSPEVVEVAQIVRDLDLQMRPLIEGKGLRFEIVVADDTPRSVITDGLRFRQVLINLLGNAAKFTTRGSVLLTVSLDESLAEPRLAVAVSDSGLGMSERRLERIFEPFVQADSSISRNHGGTGLGLSITRELVALLGGDISVASQLGRGSTFRVRVPVGGVPTGVPRQRGATGMDVLGPTDLATRRWRGGALVIDDSGVARKIAVRLLRQQGFDVVEAGSAIEGLDRFTEMDGTCRLVLVDLQMPRVDGAETARRFRDRGYGGALVAMSASPSYEEIALAAGCDA